MTWSRYPGGTAPPGREGKTGGGEVMWDLDTPMGEAEAYHPPVDVYEKDDKVMIEVELPGVSKENIGVYTSRNLVVIEGVKRDPELAEEASRKRLSYIRLERKYGRFYREIKLSIPCNTRDGEARYENGLLILVFDKIQERRGQRHRIPVK